jgi:hypothetical protein
MSGNQGAMILTDACADERASHEHRLLLYGDSYARLTCGRSDADNDRNGPAGGRIGGNEMQFTWSMPATNPGVAPYPLCPDCHTRAPEAYHRIGKRAFERAKGLSFVALVARLQREWQRKCA